MVTDEHFQSGTGPVGLAPADGFPWPRMVVGVVAVAISWMLSWRVEQPPVELPPMQASLVATEPAAPIGPLRPSPPPHIVTQTSMPDAVPQPAAAAQPTLTPDNTPPAAHRHRQVQRRAVHARVRSARGPLGKSHVSRRAAAIRVARAEPDRRRVELRNEYIASRARVAAFTGEDSGSAYLAREAAHQRAAQAFSPARGTAVRRRG